MKNRAILRNIVRMGTAELPSVCGGIQSSETTCNSSGLNPESLVLALHHEATSGKIKIDAPCCKWSAVAVEDEFMRRQSFSLRAGIRCLAVPLPLPNGFHSSSRVRERISPWYLPFGRHD